MEAKLVLPGHITSLAVVSHSRKAVAVNMRRVVSSSPPPPPHAVLERA
jgi:hypothetical protein